VVGGAGLEPTTSCV